MMNSALTIILIAVLAGLLLVACALDLKERRIPNRLNLAVALLAPLWWVAQGVSLWPGVPLHLASGLVVFAILLGAMALGQMGGGDVKLAGALALWMSPFEALRFFVFFSLIGGPLTIATHLHHRRTKKEGPCETPYGLAIAAGAAIVLGQRFLNQFGG